MVNINLILQYTSIQCHGLRHILSSQTASTPNCHQHDHCKSHYQWNVKDKGTMIMSINIAMPGKSCWVALCKPFEPSSVPNLREDLDHVARGEASPLQNLY